MREIWEIAEALSKHGLWVRITRKGHLKVFRDGQKIGTLRLPRER